MNNGLKKVQHIEIKDNSVGQRIDNFLIKQCPGCPKSRLYRAVRGGEVRVNSGRIKPTYRLKLGDVVRVPPLRIRPDSCLSVPPAVLQQVQASIIYEDNELLVLNKPAGLAVHGGSGIRVSVKAALRKIYDDQQFIELVHRLDRDTSGCLLVAKSRVAHRRYAALWAERRVRKTYLACVLGDASKIPRRVNKPLSRSQTTQGERLVRVDRANGKLACTEFEPFLVSADYSLVWARPVTGRTHQIRVHAAAVGYPLVGDTKYGDFQANRAYQKCLGIERFFLHAVSIVFNSADVGDHMLGICSQFDQFWVNLIRGGSVLSGKSGR